VRSSNALWSNALGLRPAAPASACIFTPTPFNPSSAPAISPFRPASSPCGGRSPPPFMKNAAAYQDCLPGGGIKCLIQLAYESPVRRL
jgi:hypothetical protein